MAISFQIMEPCFVNLLRDMRQTNCMRAKERKIVAMAKVKSYVSYSSSKFDPLGSWTGLPICGQKPTQDADDL